MPVPVSGKKPYDLIIDFAELPDQQFSDYEQLEFTLPEGFTLPDNFNEMNYTVDIDMGIGGKLRNNRITFDKTNNKIFLDWNQSDENAFNNFRGSSTAKFTLALSGNLDPSKGKLVFSADKQLRLTHEDLHNAIVQKTYKYVPYQLNYEIRVTSDGTNSNLTLTDEMGTALVNPSTVNMSFLGGRHEGDPAYQPTLESNENGKFVVHIPQMDDEDVLIIQYISPVDVDKIARSANATFDEVGNTAKVVGDNDPSDNEDSAWNPDIEFSDIEKSSLGTKYYKKDGIPYCDVTWQVITNHDALVSLAGSTLTDVMGEDAITYSRYSGEGITVKCYDENGDLAAVRSIPWEDLGTDITTATSFTYDIPETDRPYRYVMEYKTSVRTTDLIKQTFVTNTVTGKCGIAEAGELINPPGLDDIAVSKKATNIHSDHVTWEVKVDISNDSLDGQIKLSEAQADSSGNITDGLYRLPRTYIPSYVDEEGNQVPDRNCQEALEKLEIIGLEEGERVRVYYYYGNNERYYDSDASMWNDGVLTMTGFQSSTSERWPDNRFYMYFYKDDQHTPGLNEPEDGSRKRSIILRMTNSFPVSWANMARDYINCSEVYRPGVFTHTNWVVVNGVKATDAFNTQPTNIYKHVMNDGQNYLNNNPITTVTIAGTERSVIYPVYRFTVAVNGINTDDPIVIEDTFDTSLFKLFDHRDFGGSRCYVEAVDGDGNHKYNWINWIKPTFGAQPEITWNGAAGGGGPSVRLDKSPATDMVIDGYRVMENDNVRAEETAYGAKFTFKNLDFFKKKNGQYYNFYLVDYYLVPRSIEALAELEKRLYGDESQKTPIENIASFREDTTKALTFYPHKNSLEPVSKTYYRNGNETDESGEQHPRLDFSIEINPGKVSLNEGRNMEVRDTYSSSLSIDYRSVRIQTEPEADVSYDFSGNVGTFIIPDNTSVRITYTATVISQPEPGLDSVEFSNTVAVNGYSADIHSNADVAITSGGEAITPEIFIFKYRSNHMETGLNDAVFELLDENKQPIVIDDQPFHMTSVHDSVTGKDGQIHLKLDQQEHGFTLSADRFYYIHEVTPPENYYPSDVYYQFKIRTDGTVDYSNREYLNGDTLNVRNSPKSMDVILNKEIKGNVALTAADLDELSFRLEKFDETTQQWVVHEDSNHNVYDDLKYADFGTVNNGSTTLRNLEMGRYRLTETGNDAIKANHPGAEAYVHYVLEDNTSGADSSVEFEITRDHLEWSDNRTITFTNTYSTDTIDRKATKRWYDTEGNEINWPKGLELRLDVVTLDDDGVNDPVLGTNPVKSVTLDGKADDNGEFIAGTASFNGLPKYKSDGQTPQEYAVVEGTTYEGYDHDREYYPLSAGEPVLLKNTKKATEITVTKRWVGDLPTGATATLRLWAYPHNGSSADARMLHELAVTADQNCESVTPLANGEEWLIKFTNIPLTNDADVPLDYFITETDCSAGYEPTYPAGQTNALPNEVIVNAVAKTAFTVTKHWRNTQGNLWAADKEIRLTLSRSLPDGTPDDAFTLSFTVTDESCIINGTAPDGVTATVRHSGSDKYIVNVEGLEKFTPDGSRWHYSVTEDPVDGFTTVYQDDTHADITDSAGSAPHNGHIINTGEVYSLTVGKTVTGNFGDKQKSFLFSLLITDADGTPYTGTLSYEKEAPGEDDLESLQFNEDGIATFTLVHGETICFDKIPGTLSYTLTEERSGARGYAVQSSANGVPRQPSDSAYMVHGPLCTDAGSLIKNQRVDYVNDRNKLIPTGVETEIMGSVVTFLLMTAALAVMMCRRRFRRKAA